MIVLSLFISVSIYHKFNVTDYYNLCIAQLAQLVEHQTFNLRVMVSNPISGYGVSGNNRFSRIMIWKRGIVNFFCHVLLLIQTT